MSRPIDIYGFLTDCGACIQGEVRRMVKEGLGEDELECALDDTTLTDTRKKDILNTYNNYLRWYLDEE